jgi:phosphoribosyl-ATP pyrophosphohydrolase
MTYMGGRGRYVDAVAQFHTELAAKLRAEGYESKAQLQDLDQTFYPGNELAELRARLILEEAKELSYALMTENKEQVLKEQCDLLYVTFALTSIYDLPTLPAFNRVHANNLAKINKGAIKDGKLTKPKDHPKVSLSDLF